jgi:uncharacterized repeat protein (TIGR01451 family)
LIEVDSNSVPIDTISVLSGTFYLTYGPPGTIYAFKVLSAPLGTTPSCPSSGIIFDTIQSYVNLYSTSYMGFNCSSFASFDLGVYATARLGMHTFRTNILVMNAYCTPTPASLSFATTPRLMYGGASPLPSAASGSIASWNFSFASFVHPINVALNLNAPGAFFTPGDTIHSVYTVGPSPGDVDTTNNVIVKIDTSRSGCDPNYIEVSPEGYISSGTQLQYIIQFENTGNDTAFNIHIMDTLSNLEDAHSLRMVAASAEMNTVLFKVGGQNIIKFDFPHINLLDSSHHGQCDGMVVFKINTLTGLPDGTIIPNRAGIYFDDNTVVMTNTVNNIIGLPTTSVSTVNQDRVELYPNPAKDELIIKMQPDAFNSVEITDAVGKVLIRQAIGASKEKINIVDLTGGLYYVTLKGTNGNAVKKFVKM